MKEKDKEKEKSLASPWSSDYKKWSKQRPKSKRSGKLWKKDESMPLLSISEEESSSFEDERSKQTPKITCKERLMRFPYFIVTVTLVDMIMLCYSIYLNGGVQPWKVLKDLCPDLNSQENPLFGPRREILERLGAKDTYLIVQDKEWWRLFTPVFLHVGIIHLLANLYFQLRLGCQTEWAIGTIRMAFIYIVSGIGGNLASAIFLPNVTSVGASGALFGLFGALLASAFKNWKAADRPCCDLVSLVFAIVLNLLIGLLPLIDNFCHLGGLFTGFFTGSFILPVVIRHRPTYIYTTTYCAFRYFVFGILGVCGCVIGFGVGFWALYSNVNVYVWCKWCPNIDCIQVWDWCQQYS